MTAQNKSFKNAFIQERQNRVDLVVEEAQRLVNLYRHSEAFGEDFMPKLDEMLLAASSEVQTAMSTILGGQVVRQYCEFLQKKVNPQKTDAVKEKPDLKPKGYLPDPEKSSLPPVIGVGGTGLDTAAFEVLFKNFLSAHQQELSELLKAQSDTLSALLQRFDKNTHEVASHQTDRLINALQQEAGKQKQYSDVIESTPQTPVLVPDEMEGF